VAVEKCIVQGKDKGSEDEVGASDEICRSAPTSSRIYDGQPEYIRPSWTELRMRWGRLGVDCSTSTEWWTRPFPAFHQPHAKQPHRSLTVLSSTHPPIFVLDPPIFVAPSPARLHRTLARPSLPTLIIASYWSFFLPSLCTQFGSQCLVTAYQIYYVFFLLLLDRRRSNGLLIGFKLHFSRAPSPTSLIFFIILDILSLFNKRRKV